MAGMLLTNRARQSLGGLGVSSGRGTLLTTARARNQYKKQSNSLLPTTSTASAGVASGQNNGGVIGGIGYVGHKLGLGVLSTLEGIWDYTAGGIAKLFGADEWAEEQMANGWVNYQNADEWYDPSEGWRIAGDVAGGIGTSAVSIGAAFIPGIGPAASIAAAGLGAAGNATKEAYRTTGKLGGAEFGYGALVGATEAALEAVTGKIGAGSQRIASEIAERMGRSSAKEITKTVGKVSAKKVLGQIGKDFAGEAFEEGMAEILSPFYKNVTYSEGEKIDWKSVGYNALVGGISGIVMGGTQQGASSALNYRRGNKAINTGGVTEIMAEAKRFYDTEIGADASLGTEGDPNAKGTGNPLFAAVRENYQALQESLKETNGELRTAKQKMLVGALQQQNVAARLSIFVEKSAANIVRNAPNVATRAESFGLTDESGTPVSFTAEQLTEGVDLTDLNSKAGQKRFWRSLRTAMVKNPVLSKLAVMDATGHLLLDTQKFAAAEQSALRLAEQTDLNQFLERADAKEKAALAERLGIEDFNMLSHESFRAAVAEMAEDGDGMREFAKQNARIKQAVSAENAAVLPETLTNDLADGVYRADVQGNGLSVLKEGENFFVVQPTTRKISRALDAEELTSTLRGVRSEVAAEGRLAIKYPQFSEEVIEANMGEIAEMDAVSNIDASKLEKTGKRPKDMFAEYFASLGNSIYSDVFGDISLGNSSVKSEVRHGITAEKIASIEAIPSVIENGKVIFHEFKPDSDVERLVVCAPIKIAGEDYYMGVMLQRDLQNQRLYLHAVASLKIGKEGTVSSQADRVTNGALEDNNHLFTTSILQKAIDVKINKQKNPTNDTNSDTSANLEGERREQAPALQRNAETESEQTAEDGGKARREAIAIDVWARENIPDYAGLNAPAKAAVRATVRNARANGIAESDVKTYARVAARSGLNISFDTAQAAGGDARFDGRNTVYVSPAAPAERIQSKLLLHEGGHALFFKTKSGKKLLARAVEMADTETAAEVRKQYTEYYEKQNVDKSAYEPIILEEIAAAGLESALGVDGAWEFILSKRPTAGEKLLSFFRGAARDYAGVGELSAEARKLLRTYQKAFAELSAYNKGNNAVTGEYGENVTKNGHNITENGQIVTENGENGSKTKKAADDGGRLARAKGKQRTYSYNELVRKGDLTGIVVKKGQQISFKSNGTIDSTAVIDAVKNKCEALTTARAGTVYYVEVPDIGKRVEITRTGIEHGYHEGLKKSRKAAFDKAKINARVSLELPQLLKNSIEVNISDRSDNLDVPYSHVMMGTVALEDSNGVLEYYAVRSVIEERVNQNPVLAEMNVLGKLHAANAKKIGPPNGRGGNTVALTVADAYTYSIADFLQNVKGVFNDTFSLDVYQRLGVPRAVNDFSKNMRFALPKDGEPKVPTWGKESYSFAEVAGEKLTAEEVADFQGTLEKKVGAERTKYKAKAKDFVFTRAASIYIDTVDELYGISHFLKNAGGVRDAAAIVNVARSSISQAQTMIGHVQYDLFAEKPKKLGKGLQKILAPVMPQIKAFNNYLLNYHNVDRMSLEERSGAQQIALAERVDAVSKKIKVLEKNGKKVPDEMRAELKAAKEALAAFVPMKNKPLFDKDGETVTAKQSENLIAEYEHTHPEFKKVAEEVWAFFRNLNQMRVDAGLISQTDFNRMQELYPHYVPAYRDVVDHGKQSEAKTLAVNKTVKRAVGGTPVIVDILRAGAEQVQATVRAAQINRIAAAIADAAQHSGSKAYVEIVSREKSSRAEQRETDAGGLELRPKDNQIIFFRNGEKITMQVSDEIFKGFEGLYQPTVELDSFIYRVLNRINGWFKKLVTSWSPAFAIRNPIRDLQDAGINSRHPALFAKNLPIAVRTIARNGELWQQYCAMGGFSASVFGADGIKAAVGERGFETLLSLINKNDGRINVKEVLKVVPRAGKNVLTLVENINSFVEQIPRFAEYLASIEAGDSVAVALNNSAEVTTNFGRRGRLTKKLNATIMPFLNPAIQGFDKIFRNVKDAVTGEELARGIAALVSKLVLIGILPTVLNALLYEDDEDYQMLDEAQKENSFLFKVGDTFVKIPRGRVASVIGGAANRIRKSVKGEDADWGGYLSNAVSQVTPVENMTRTIFSPFVDVSTNTTWYGSAIEGRQFENTAPRDRYDESTSKIAIWLGQRFNYSPKKIHYLLDQYSGVIGDFVLPATTSKAEKGFFSGNFTIDPVTSNKLSDEFYELLEEAQYAKTAGDDTAIYQVRYFNRRKDAINKMYDEISKIQQSELSNAEKLQQTRVIRVLINEAYKTAMQDYALFTEAVGATEMLYADPIFDDMIATGISEQTMSEQTMRNLRFTEAWRLVYGAKSALEVYDENVYGKATLLSGAGVSYDIYYNYYFTLRGITSDKDKEGETVAGSKRKKVVKAISALPSVSVEQRLLLICASGYALKDGDVRGLTATAAKKRLLRYILSQKGMSAAQKAEIAEMCGFEVKNGRIRASSVK